MSDRRSIDGLTGHQISYPAAKCSGFSGRMLDMHCGPRFPASPRSETARKAVSHIDSSVGSRLPQFTPSTLSLPGFASLEAHAQAGQIRTEKLRHHDAANLSQEPSPEHQPRTLIEFRHDGVGSIETSSLQAPCRGQTVEKDWFQSQAMDRDSNRPISGGGDSGSADCKQPTGSNTKIMRSKRSPVLKRRRKTLPPSSSPSPVEHCKTPRTKVTREKEARSKQARCFQNMEDFLGCVLRWEAPKKQMSGNVEKSGLVGDKQQMMEASHILSEVLVQHTISPLQSEPGETSLQTVVREAKCRIEAHLSDGPDVVLPSSSLMADEATSSDRPYTATRDHIPCLPDSTKACIKCRKQHRGMMFERNLQKLSVVRNRSPSVGQ